MRDRSRRGRPLATSRSSGLFAGGLCCSIRARPFSLAWRRNRNKHRGQNIREGLHEELHVSPQAAAFNGIIEQSE